MAKNKTRDGVWRCVGGFAAPDGDHVVSVPDGALVPHEFPYEILDGREHLFEDVTSSRPVEQATAAPGERRSTRRGRKAPAPADSGDTPDVPAADEAPGDETVDETPEA